MTKGLTRARTRAWVSSWLSAHANLVFSGSPRVGVLLALATLVEPRFFALSLVSFLAAKNALRWLKIPADGYSPYGYNAILVGLGVANGYALDAGSLGFAAALGAMSVIMTAALLSSLGRVTSLPVLSLPFVLTASLSAGVSPFAPLRAAPPAADLLAMALPPWFSLGLESLGSILFLPNALAGVLVWVALLVHSRIAAMLAACGLCAVLTLDALAHVPLAHRVLLLASFNAILAAIAVGGVWFIPSRSSFALSFASAVVAFLLALGLSGPLGRLGLPVLVLPFNLTVVAVLFATRQRAVGAEPHAADLVQPTPEASLRAFQAQKTRGGLYGLRFRLPFRGAWTCTQGVDGAFTHKDIWRHAYDFEVHAGGEGTLCLDRGERIEDYHCYRLPILAAADGTVVAIENDVPDNAIGDINDRAPWGNRVTVQHGFGLYSTVAHLVRGSVAVVLGQYVRAGDVVGYCGNSGRSPRPHLHFQLQVGPTMLAPTLPCRFSHAVIRSPAADFLETEIAVREGMAVRNLESDPRVGSYFDFPLGQTAARLFGATTETIESAVDGAGRLMLRSREHGATLNYERSEEGFAACEVQGPGASALHLLRVALARVPFEGGDIPWRHRIAKNWLRGPVLRALSDFALPFWPEGDFEIVYQRSWDGERLVVSGASVEQRDGRPCVRTRAVLLPGNPLSVEVVVARRTLRAEVATLDTGPSLAAFESAFSSGESMGPHLEGGA